ncbi:hypothetical protein [Alkaliphilus oremlandii]|uniref:Uncharacterized protein n=1 Tax=Alkaliphilus oremlandii (strain OhILAs) TaxID=350688 RepID=A8MJ30_ALKOO|nr:hypothetical protein [Alkaliphilus oremlandii]ABW19812.1 hypothetical protein Clos_2279 [Alkaliphilus oremlandii OhILAs]
MNTLWILFAGVMGSVSAYWISIHLNKGAVMGAAVVTLLSGIIFPYIHPEIGKTLAVVATTGAYAGMISKKNIPHILEMVAIGIIVGTIFLLATTTYVGVGGKLGTMAAISCFTWMGIKKIFNATVNKEICATKEIPRHKIKTENY